MRLTVGAVAIGVGAAAVRAGVEAFRRGSLPEIPLLMAATTKALVESLPGKPAAPAVAEQTLGVPAATDSSHAVRVATDSAVPVATLPASPLTVETVSLTTPATASYAAPAAPVTPPPAPTAPIAPVIAEGRTELEGGMFAMRAGDTVTVYFDTPELRTRRPDKFEQIVRATLPATHGRSTDALLASVAPGGLIGSADLVNDLPTKGLHLRASDGRELTLWPETRPGRDGPLVVAYRATPTR